MNKRKAAKRNLIKTELVQKKLCFVIITANRPDAVDGNLLSSAEGFYKCGIDVYVYDSSDDDKTKYIVEWYSKKYNNIKYVRWNGRYDGVSIDNKVIDAYKEFSEKYDYVWLSRDGLVFNTICIFSLIKEYISKGIDVISINDSIRNFKFIRSGIYEDIRLFFKDCFVEMNTLGLTIVKSSFIKEVIKNEPLNGNNYGLWQPVSFFVYASKHHVTSAVAIGAIFLPILKAEKSHFWMKKIFYQWCDRWINYINYLPDYYNEYKRYVIKPKTFDFSPFSLENIMMAKKEGCLKISDIFSHRKKISIVSDTELWKFYVVYFIPRFLLKRFYKIYLKGKRVMYCPQFQGWQKPVLRNYDKIENCFEKTKGITSFKLYEQNDVSDPFITIVIPTYKRTDLFKEAIKSVLNQRLGDFKWDILVVDNEPYEGKSNETEKYICSLNLKNVTYYRNAENMRPGDNFNRGILLAKAPWIMMLHDDDLLTADALVNMERSIRFLSTQKGKPLGAIAAGYYQFHFDPDDPRKSLDEIAAVEKNHLSSSPSYMYFKLTHANVLCTGHIGGSVPSNGAVYNRQAVLKTGGFNEDNGISGDLILYYNLEDRYSVYHNLDMTGYYRWGNNSMSLPEASYKTIRDNYLFREYVFSKTLFHRIYGKLFRSTLYYFFTKGVIEQRKKVFSDYTDFAYYAGIYNMKPNKFMRSIFKKITKVYSKIKRIQMKRLRRKAKEFFKVKKG